jgi:hypothetical protein
MILIATEKKTGAQLLADEYNEDIIISFASHFEDPQIELSKDALIQRAQKITTSYILQYYSDAKQRSNVSDKENGESYLAYKGLDTTEIRKDITSLILSNNDFQTALNTLNQKYNTNNEQMISYWLSQVLKVAYRQYFVFLVKQEYSEYISKVKQAEDTSDLQHFEIKTPFPALP